MGREITYVALRDEARAVALEVVKTRWAVAKRRAEAFRRSPIILHTAPECWQDATIDEVNVDHVVVSLGGNWGRVRVYPDANRWEACR